MAVNWGGNGDSPCQQPVDSNFFFFWLKYFKGKHNLFTICQVVLGHQLFSQFTTDLQWTHSAISDRVSISSTRTCAWAEHLPHQCVVVWLGRKQGNRPYLESCIRLRAHFPNTFPHSSTPHRGLFNIPQPSLCHQSIHALNPYNTTQVSVAKSMSIGSYVNTIHTTLNSAHWLLCLSSFFKVYQNPARWQRNAIQAGFPCNCHQYTMHPPEGGA